MRWCSTSTAYLPTTAVTINQHGEESATGQPGRRHGDRLAQEDRHSTAGVVERTGADRRPPMRETGPRVPARRRRQAAAAHGVARRASPHATQHGFTWETTSTTWSAWRPPDAAWCLPTRIPTCCRWPTWCSANPAATARCDNFAIWCAGTMLQLTRYPNKCSARESVRVIVFSLYRSPKPLGWASCHFQAEATTASTDVNSGRHGQLGDFVRKNCQLLIRVDHQDGVRRPRRESYDL